MTLSRRRLLGVLVTLGLVPGAALATCVRPTRVVTLFQGATDTALALGVTPVGIVESWQHRPVYPYLRAALDGVPLVGLETQPSLEDIALIAPDIIVASRFRHHKIAPLLARIAPVVMLEKIHRFRTTLAVMAGAMDCEQQAERLTTQYLARTSALKARLASHFGPRWPVSVSLIDIRADQVRSYLPTSFAGQVLTDLGFAWNMTARSTSGLMLKLGGVESLPAVDAEVFFVMRHSASPVVAARERRLMAHPLWQRMAAPRAGRVVAVDPVSWSLSGGILGVFNLLDDISAWLDRLEGSA